MFTYIVSRFMFSLGSDFYSPKYMLSGGLFLSGVVILSLSGESVLEGFMHATTIRIFSLLAQQKSTQYPV